MGRMSAISREGNLSCKSKLILFLCYRGKIVVSYGETGVFKI